MENSRLHLDSVHSSVDSFQSDESDYSSCWSESELEEEKREMLQHLIPALAPKQVSFEDKR